MRLVSCKRFQFVNHCCVYCTAGCRKVGTVLTVVIGPDRAATYVLTDQQMFPIPATLPGVNNIFFMCSFRTTNDVTTVPFFLLQQAVRITTVVFVSSNLTIRKQVQQRRTPSGECCKKKKNRTAQKTWTRQAKGLRDTLTSIFFLLELNATSWTRSLAGRGSTTPNCATNKGKKREKKRKSGTLIIKKRGGDLVVVVEQDLRHASTSIWAEAKK